MTARSRYPVRKGKDEPQQEPQFATDEDIKRLEEAAKFWDNPEVKRLLAERERERQEADRG